MPFLPDTFSWPHLFLAQAIDLYLREGARFDLGNKNKLASVTYGGGDAGGGNATVTYNYSNFNRLSVRHLQDPAGLP